MFFFFPLSLIFIPQTFYFFLNFFFLSYFTFFVCYFLPFIYFFLRPYFHLPFAILSSLLCWLLCVLLSFHFFFFSCLLSSFHFFLNSSPHSSLSLISFFLFFLVSVFPFLLPSIRPSSPSPLRAACLRVRPDRSQFFRYDSISLSCEDQLNSTGWKVKRKTSEGGVRPCSSGWGFISSGSTCIIRNTYPSDTGVYWCESEDGEKSNGVNITITGTARNTGNKW